MAKLGEALHGAVRRGTQHEIWVFVFQIYQICHDEFDCCRFWVMVLPVGWNWWDLVDLEFNFWFCAVGLNGLRGGFEWLAVVVPIFGRFRWFWVFYLFIYLFFTLLQTHRVEYFSEHFPRMQTNTEKNYFSWNHLYLKIFYNVKCFTSKQTEP